MRKLISISLVALAAACANGAYLADDATAPKESAMTQGASLDAVLAAQSEETKARYQYRNPKETLMFFGVEPGMTVVDTLPGSVWYSGILSQYLGADGLVIGANYSLDQRAALGGRYATEEYRQENLDWPERWAGEQNEQRGEADAPFSAFFYGDMPDTLEGSADVVLMVRATHHFNRTEAKGGYFTQALQDAFDILKPGGVLGIVQHRAPEESSDEWAIGNAGYVKQSHIINMVTSAGFELVDVSEINANPKDQPTEEDYVWRLPPTLGTTRGYEDDPAKAALREKLISIGESDRMTVKFRKPS